MEKRSAVDEKIQIAPRKSTTATELSRDSLDFIPILGSAPTGRRSVVWQAWARRKGRSQLHATNIDSASKRKSDIEDTARDNAWHDEDEGQSRRWGRGAEIA